MFIFGYWTICCVYRRLQLGKVNILPLQASFKNTGKVHVSFPTSQSLSDQNLNNVMLTQQILYKRWKKTNEKHIWKLKYLLQLQDLIISTPVSRRFTRTQYTETLWIQGIKCIVTNLIAVISKYIWYFECWLFLFWHQ